MMQAIRILAAAALVLVASTAAAQAGQGAPGGQGMGMNSQQNVLLFKDITLTDAQKATIDTIQARAREEMMAMRQAGGMQDPANRERMMQMRQKQTADIRAVLTPEQQLVYDKNVAAMPQGAGRRPPSRR